MPFDIIVQLLETLKPVSIPEERGILADALSEIYHSIGLEPFRRRVLGRKICLCKYSPRSISMLKDDRILPPFAEAICAEHEPEYLSKLILALSEIEDPRAITSLDPYIHHRDPNVRSLADYGSGDLKKRPTRRICRCNKWT